MKNLKYVEFINCVCCGYSIEIDDCFYNIQKFKFNKEKRKDFVPVQYLWKGGSVFKLKLGYDSTNTGDIFYLGICDKCVKNQYENGRLIYDGDFVNVDRFTDDELNQFDLRRNRERNLNKLGI